jgi:OFA family oxalate/formate antiporter-like MFS transporter
VKRAFELASLAGILFFLGGIYAWSAFVPALRASYGYSSAQVQTVFGLTIGTLCGLSPLAGLLAARVRPRRLFQASGILIAASYLGAGRFGGHYPLLVFFFAGVGGIGVACGYVCALATAIQAYPARRGMATGVVVAGYAAGAILLSAIAQYLLARGMPVLRIFHWVGLFYGPAILLLSLAAPRAEPPLSADRPGLNWKIWTETGFLRMAAGMFGGSFAALALIGNLKPMALNQEVGSAAAGWVIAVLSIGSVTGRLSWGHLLDQWGERFTVRILLATTSAALLLFLLAKGFPLLFLSAAFSLGFAYGGYLAVYPALTAHRYGSSLVGSTYPFLLWVHGAAALLGPWVSGKGFDWTGSFLPALWIGLGLMAFTLALHLLPRRDL